MKPVAIRGAWQNAAPVEHLVFVCGYCSERQSSSLAFYTNSIPQFRIYICSNCRAPTLVTPTGERYPADMPGANVRGIPEPLQALYDEARHSASAGAYTAAVLVCRKMLMNIGVSEGASENQSFLSYVDFLAGKGFVPPRGKSWVDYIRTKGNEANHEIALMSETDARALIGFIEMLLRFIYEMPLLVPAD